MKISNLKGLQTTRIIQMSVKVYFMMVKYYASEFENDFTSSWKILPTMSFVNVQMVDGGSGGILITFWSC